MENCYSLLGIAPTADTNEIEEAYRKKKIEFGEDASKQQALESAYNEAIMASFAPIRAFSSPLPPLTTGKRTKPADQPTPVRDEPQVQDPPAQTPPASPPRHKSVDSRLQTPIQPTFQSSHTGAAEPVDKSVQDLVEESHAPFTDTQLMNMDVSELREGYMLQMEDNEVEETGFLTLGIENRLLRFYIWTFLLMMVFDIAMRLLMGPKWLALTEIYPENIPAPVPPFLSVAYSIISIAYCFVCALPAPFGFRFFILGQPPEKRLMMWALCFIGVVFAFLLRWLGALLLPLDIVGSLASLAIISMAICLKTLRYEGE